MDNDALIRCNAIECTVRQTCFRYRGVGGVRFENLDKGKGIDCNYRLPINCYEPRELQDWREVDKKHTRSKALDELMEWDGKYI